MTTSTLTRTTNISLIFTIIFLTFHDSFDFIFFILSKICYFPGDFIRRGQRGRRHYHHDHVTRGKGTVRFCSAQYIAKLSGFFYKMVISLSLRTCRVKYWKTRFIVNKCLKVMELSRLHKQTKIRLTKRMQE